MGDALFFSFLAVMAFMAVMVLTEVPRRIVRSWFEEPRRQTANWIAWGVSGILAIASAAWLLWWIKQPTTLGG